MMKKCFKKSLSFIFVLLLVFSSVTVSNLAFAEDTFKTGDIVTYGSYPQSVVTDSAVLTALGQLVDGKKWITYDFYEGTGSTDSAEKAELAKYQDIIYGGSKYRAVSIIKQRPQETGAKSIPGLMQDNNGYLPSNIYFFRFDKIKWVVLDPDAGLVISLDCLDSQPFFLRYISGGDNTISFNGGTTFAADYAASYIREWLNNDFFNTAFYGDLPKNISEKRIVTYGITPEKLPDFDHNATTVTDKIYLPSYDDVISHDYGFTTIEEYEVIRNNQKKIYSEAFEERFAAPSDYAKAMGINCNDIFGLAQSTVPGIWLLRNASTQTGVWLVNKTGLLGSQHGIGTDTGIRPEISVDLSKVNKSYINYEIDGKTYSVSSVSDITTPERDGYTFVKWDEAAPGNPEGDDIWITPVWKKNQHTLTFNSGDGSFENSVKEIKSDVFFGETLSSPSLPVKNGYLCDGWNDGKKTYTVDEIASMTMPDKNLTFTAVYKPCRDTPYSLEIYEENLDGELKLTDSKQLSAETDSTVYANQSEKTGFYIDSENSVLSEKVSAGGTTKLKVIYLRKLYKISFNFNDGVTAGIPEAEYKYGTPMPQHNIPERKGYSTTGWNAPETVCENKEYKLEWTANTYLLHYETADGTPIEDKYYKYGESLPEAPESVDRRGYTFAGWDKITPETMPYNDLVITALWEPVIYNIKWFVDGKEFYSQQAKIGDAVVTPRSPYKKGYTFTGWDNKIPLYVDNTDLTFNAEFTLNPVTVKINTPSITTVKYGDILILSASTSELPENFKLVWKASNGDFALSPNGKECKCRAEQKGLTSITVTPTLDGEVLKDAEGKTVSAEIKLTAKCGFFQKLVSFFKDLFKVNREIR